jgi:glutathione S-transferase/environmental stress-induced protein Ves
MQLYYSTGSPYARVIRVALREAGLLPQVRESVATLRDPASVLLPYNPVGRVPTLLLADGTVLTETPLILDHLDSLGAPHRLLPPTGPARWAAAARLGQVIGLLDGVAVWNRELRRPEHERSPGVIALETGRANRVLDTLEGVAVAWGFSGAPDAPRIALGCVLGYAEQRHRAWAWRDGRPRLAAWFEAMAARPSFQATIPPPSGLYRRDAASEPIAASTLRSASPTDRPYPPMPDRLRRFAELAITRWRNGLGRKAEVAGGEGWGLSFAWIDEDAPFSHYPGQDRSFTLLEGDGVRLDLEGRPPLVVDRRWQPAVFPCDVPTECRLLGSPCLVVNLIAARALWRQSVEVVALAGELAVLPLGGPCHAVVLEGEAILPDGAQAGRHDSIGVPGRLVLQGAARLAIARLQPL